jgi:hypothetical protein
VQNAQWGALRGENTKPRTSTHHQYMKQVVQADGQKTRKGTKPRRGLACCHKGCLASPTLWRGSPRTLQWVRSTWGEHSQKVGPDSATA